MWFQPGNDPQQCGFAAARWANDTDQFANIRKIFDDEGYVLDGDFRLVPGSEFFCDILEHDDIRPSRGC